jgi:hypothetical protein
MDSKGRSLYLPKGTWHDFFDETPPEAGGNVVQRPDVPLDRIPVFVRAGTILPMGSPMQYTGEIPNDPLAVHFYSFAEDDVSKGEQSSQFDVYEDDGLTMKFDAGELARTHLAFKQTAAAITFDMSVESSGFSPPSRACQVVVHGFGTAPPSAVRLDGVDVAAAPDGATPDASSVAAYWQMSSVGLTVSLPTCTKQTLEVTR